MPFYQAKFIVYGHVQGVGFRYFTAREAKSLELTGYAKNLSDGCVEVLVQGEEAKIDILASWLNTGPKTASVDRVTEVDRNDAVNPIYGFEIS